MTAITEKAQKDFREPFRLLYLFLMGFLILWFLYFIATYHTTHIIPLYIHLFRGITVILAIYLGRLWEEKPFWLLAVLWFLLLFRILIPHPEQVLDKSILEILLFGLWLFTGCFGLARAVSEKQLRHFLFICSAVWTAGMAVYALAGIYAAWTGQTIRTIGGNGKWSITSTGFLKLVYAVNSAASLLSISAMIVLIQLFSVKRKGIRILLAIVLPVLLLPMCLTGSRTALCTFALALGGMAAMWSFRYVAQKWSSVLRWLAGIGILSVVTVGTVLVLSQVVPLFNQIKAGNIPVSAAGAEAAEKTIQEQIMREWSGKTSFLSHRELIWRAMLYYFLDNPLLLLIGTSLIDPMAGLNEFYLHPKYPQVHCHNTLLQTLLVSGIPGLLLVSAFLMFIAVRGIRLIRNGKESLCWLSLLPILVFAVWAGELVECFITLSRPDRPMQPILFICMGILCSFGIKDRIS